MKRLLKAEFVSWLKNTKKLKQAGYIFSLSEKVSATSIMLLLCNHLLIFKSLTPDEPTLIRQCIHRRYACRIRLLLFGDTPDRYAPGKLSFPVGIFG